MLHKFCVKDLPSLKIALNTRFSIADESTALIALSTKTFDNSFSGSDSFTCMSYVDGIQYSIFQHEAMLSNY